jgi:periplasmic protein TonB
MTADSPAMPAGTPALLHCLPYLVLALALHGLVLVVTANFLLDRPDALLKQVLSITLEMPSKLDAVAAPLPLASPSVVEPVPRQPRPQQAPKRELPALALQKEAKPNPNPFPVTEAAIALLDAPAMAALGSPGAPAVSLTTPRYDAAYLNNPAPDYPALSRRLGEEGKVLLKVRVSAEGSALAVNLEKSSNFERLDEAARAAVARWRFVPARRGDEAVESSVVVPLVFRLDG